MQLLISDQSHEFIYNLVLYKFAPPRRPVVVLLHLHNACIEIIIITILLLSFQMMCRY